MRVRGAGRSWRTLSRLALIGVIGGGAAACSTDASRLSDPFSNPFSSSEPSATGSLADEGEGFAERAPAIRTPRIQSQELAAPGLAAPAMTPRTATRIAAAEPVPGAISGQVSNTVSGMNPDAGRNMTPRVAPAAPQPKLTFGPGRAPAATAAERAAAAKREAEAKRAEAKATEKAAEAKAVAARKAEADKAAEIKKATEARKAAEARKLAARSGKGEDRGKDQTARTADKTAAKPGRDPREVKAEEAKLARAEAAKEAKAEAARKVAEAKAAEAAAKASAKESAKETPKETRQAAREAEKPAEKVAAKPEPASTGSVADASFRWPAKGRVINGYGSGNEGINIAVPEGTPVKAAEEGTVAYAGSDVKGYGKLVLVRHTNGYVSAYAHNGEIDVRPGEKVKRGQTIAKSGATGNVTSPQLHFEIRKGATPVDPIPHLASN